MSEIVVVYELDKPTAGDAEPSVLRVHAVPAAPGMTAVAGPRTYCGRDTFAMEVSSWRPGEHPGDAWYDPQYASLVCAACADAV
ncbi:hypothetical protein OG625_05145 [Streptomyces sp. NBC_01351]|uniref:hypothetical protein n=1 Tax=Streptomyces sp. NBC_01351 TaxID=2903833 RepID=UPI002E339E47|nr:hypothetical protein [Streptomyces sp. NBC_01351]